jgi:uncharacterized protein (TIGR03437 family)
VQALLPGSYGGTVTFAANTAANGNHTVAVNLVISAGAPVIASLFPTSVVMAPTVDPVVTINGANFFSTSVASVGLYGGPDPTGLQCTQSGTPTAMTSQQLLSQTVVQASIPKGNALLASQNQLCVCVTNPAPPSNPGQAPACAPLTPDYTFHVISSSTMAVTSVVNAASYLQTAKQVTAPDPVSAGQTSVSPGEIVSIFGQNLGPSTPVPAIPGPTPAEISSSPALAASIVTSSLTSLVFQINGAAAANTVTVNFTLDPFYTTNPLGTAEPLANIVAYINQLTKTAGFGSSVASLTSGGAYITLTSPTVGASSTLVVLDGGGATAASRALQFTTNANVSSSGSDTATFPYSLSNMQVLFTYGATTTPAPIIMVSSNQINAMVPFEIAAAITNPPAAPGTAALKVLSNTGNATFSSPIVVVNENPGIFTLGGLGTGQGAVLNCDSSSAWTVNGAKNTAPRGTAICIYATGLGVLTTPLAADNLPAGLATDKVFDPVQVTIGGQPAVVTYAGTSYGSIGGLTQINAIVPPTVTPGQAVSLVVTGGTATTARASQAGVTVAVK